MPSFDELLQEALRVLERDGRTSYRALKRRFEIDDEYLEDLKEELIHARGVARDEDGRGLGSVPPTAARRPPRMRPAGATAPCHHSEKGAGSHPCSATSSAPPSSLPASIQKSTARSSPAIMP